MTWWGELLGCICFALLVVGFAFAVEWIKGGGDR